MRLGTMLFRGLYNQDGLQNDEFAIAVLKEMEKGTVFISEESYFPFPLVSKASEHDLMMVERLKQQYDADICHIIKRKTSNGTECCYIIPPENTDELKYNLKHNVTLAIVASAHFAEIGTIGIKSHMGGFTRTA